MNRAAAPGPSIKVSDSSSRQLGEFVDLGDALSMHHAASSITMRPYAKASLPFFSQVPHDLQNLILAGMRENLALFEEMNSAGEKLVDSPRLLWRSLKRIGWTPRSDIFQYIEDGDVVEMYDASKIQIFRNLEFFRFVSLTLEEIVSLPLGIAYDFEATGTEFYTETAERILSQTITATERVTIAPYIVEEKSGDRFRVEIQIKWVSPVFQNERVVGVIVIHRPRLLSRQ